MKKEIHFILNNDTVLLYGEFLIEFNTNIKYLYNVNVNMIQLVIYVDDGT